MLHTFDWRILAICSLLTVSCLCLPVRIDGVSLRFELRIVGRLPLFKQLELNVLSHQSHGIFKFAALWQQQWIKANRICLQVRAWCNHRKTAPTQTHGHATLGWVGGVYLAEFPPRAAPEPRGWQMQISAPRAIDFNGSRGNEALKWHEKLKEEWARKIVQLTENTGLRLSAKPISKESKGSNKLRRGIKLRNWNVKLWEAKSH
jgi:hypothetical protein